jgi:hypothetical protein
VAGVIVLIFRCTIGLPATLASLTKTQAMKAPLLTAAALLIGTLSFAGERVTFIKGDASIFSGNNSFLVEMDLTNTSIDALDTEAAFIEYKKSKKEKGADTWEQDWNNDKKNFLTSYVEQLARATKKTSLKFSQDDPSSKYKMVLRPNHIETGNPMKYSSVEMKAHIYDMATNEEVAIIHVVPSRGAQMGPMTPTVGMRVNYAMMGSAQMMAAYIKKSLKAKK